MAKKAKHKQPPKRRAAKKDQPKQRSESKKTIKKRSDWRRRVCQAERLANVLKMLELIQSQGRWTTKALAAVLNCSERTVYRYRDVLEYAGVPWYREGPQQFLRVRPDFRFPVFSLTEDEALGQAMATAITKAPGLDVGIGASATTRKLEARSAAEVQEILADTIQLVSVLDLKLADHSKHREMIREAQFALLEESQLTGQYESPYEAGPVRLRLHPYRLCLIKNAWYVIGRQSDLEEPRTYRVARFKTLRRLNQAAEVPEYFDLREYFGDAWGAYRGDKSYDVEIWFSPEAAKIVTETVWHHTQKAKFRKDGSVTLTFHIDGLNEITNWVLRWSGQCKIVQPPELRDRFLEKLRSGIDMHSDR
jgi:predicted DNA-binding transcriptional regulator YafY